jgi:hypothetical protein
VKCEVEHRVGAENPCVEHLAGLTQPAASLSHPKGGRGFSCQNTGIWGVDRLGRHQAEKSGSRNNG